MNRLLTALLLMLTILAVVGVTLRSSAEIARTTTRYALQEPTPKPTGTPTPSPAPSPTTTPTPVPEPEPVSPTPTPFN
ncbi:MAG TPA: hypothetical protein VE863_01355 [Pyrinomonadaceae bacterium]|nr:hypothetical protein [Pyrinomonadaceae bacterium]